MLSPEIEEALDELAKSKIFHVKDLKTRMTVETIYVDNFEVIRSAFDARGSLGGIEMGSGFTLIPMDGAQLQDALRNVRHAMGGLESPSFTMHTFHARVDHILDVVRSLFTTKDLISVTKIEELQWIVYPFSRRAAGGEFQTIKHSVLGDMHEYVMDMQGASKIEATGLRDESDSLDKNEE